jgi:hypothetical protein
MVGIVSHPGSRLGMAAFEEADRFVFEIDVDPERRINQRGIARDGTIQKIGGQKQVVLDAFECDSFAIEGVDFGLAIVDVFDDLGIG